MTMRSLKTEGEASAETRGFHLYAWLEDYLAGAGLSEADQYQQLQKHIRFYDERHMTFQDWQDMIALIPLKLAVEGYPALHELTPQHIDMMVELAGDAGSERHTEECLVTGFETQGCFSSAAICNAKSVYELGRDLAAQLIVQEIGYLHENNVTGMGRARAGREVVRSKFIKGKLMDEVAFEEFVDELQHVVSIYFRPDMSEQLNTD